MRAALPLAMLIALPACGERERGSAPAATSAAPTPAVEAAENEQSSEGGESGPTNSFVVCPGHPRCPKP